jgi:long-subunit fatty acid transport protein
MQRLLIYSFVSLLTINSSFAQNEFDVLRFSNVDFYGDARFNAMGGSFGALGANMSSLSVNPGGLGVYKSSDFSFTPGFHYNHTDSKLDEKMTSDGKLNFHFSNVGLIGSFKASGAWKSVNLGIGYNRLSNYNASISINSVTGSSSLNTYVNELNADGGTLEDEIAGAFPFTSSLAYQTYLVNPIGGSTQYDHVFANSKNITQTTSYETRGGAGEMYFALGGNYSDKLYLGALIGIPSVRYVYDRNYTETSEPSDTLTEFSSFSIHDYVNTTGSGLNLKLGMIYKVADWFRVGTAFHTPTLYSLTDQYNSSITAEKKDGTVLTDETPHGSFDYLVTTPYRFVTSGSFIMGNRGVINVDYEIVDYSTARINQDAESGAYADFSIENQNIRSNFEMTQNLRVGTEIRLDPFRVRLGYMLQGDPLDGKFDLNNGSSIYSGGVGIKEDGYYIDVAYSLKQYNSQTAVVADQNDFANTSLKDHYVSFTLGFRF